MTKPNGKRSSIHEQGRRAAMDYREGKPPVNPYEDGDHLEEATEWQNGYDEEWAVMYGQ